MLLFSEMNDKSLHGSLFHGERGQTAINQRLAIWPRLGQQVDERAFGHSYFAKTQRLLTVTGQLRSQRHNNTASNHRDGDNRAGHSRLPQNCRQIVQPITGLQSTIGRISWVCTRECLAMNHSSSFRAKPGQFALAGPSFADHARWCVIGEWMLNAHSSIGQGEGQTLLPQATQSTVCAISIRPETIVTGGPAAQ
jgi:hypothetical protein